LRAKLFLLSVIVLAGCGSTPRVTDALAAWREGRRVRALSMAKDELERFRSGNHLAQADVDGSLAEVDQLMREETPLVLPDPRTPSPKPDDPTHGTDALDRGLRDDLSSTGATRSLRALRAVQRLALTRHAPMLFVMIWRHDPWTVDGPLLAGQSVALRSLTVKAFALRALGELPAH